MKVIEYEERVLISEIDYHKVIADTKLQGKELSYLEIENIYLDNTEKDIRNRGWMLRIRNTNNDQQELTLKYRNPDNSTVEVNETLDEHPEIEKILGNKLENFQEITRLKTDRIEVQFEDYLLVIDKNVYSGIVDYDLEVESDEQAKSRKIIENYCEKYGLLYDPLYKTKSQRAFEQLDRKMRPNS